jgi:hypothetical protein
VSIWRLIENGQHDDMSSNQQARPRYLDPKALGRERASPALFHDGDAAHQ